MRDADRLVTELIASREFTTLADINRMREMRRRKAQGTIVPTISTKCG